MDSTTLIAHPQAEVLLLALTNHDIAIADCKALLRERRLWLKDPKTGLRTLGSIGGAIKNDQVSEPLLYALADLESALYDGSAAALRTTQPLVALGIFQTLQGLVAIGAVTAEDIAAFYALGGGRPYADKTVSELQATQEVDRQKISVDDEINALWNEHLAPLLSSDDAPVRAEVAEALRSIAVSFEK